ncbi:MAG TPA: ATP synthase F0 subunit B [Blastocatellia bacterium]|nr:ATP synthase F0 subunit B [Blastocatellia bacterium]HMV87974.1 ATP synthase F0 subunit B [Blastocatellia bacterium]HMX28663.1 ATP synthase F0 subunit B [Blastocatellia bacterium]HMZ23023.1 ATP synthase F0 subunit B [Blastocatellia bacterium]HNG34762.1 ATP synthase F0 subunit B [Blastocatellia bacterium]
MIRTNQLCSFALFVPAFFSNAPLPLLAGGGVHPAIAKLVNLVIFLGIMIYLLRKPAKEFFANRLAEVRATLQQAAKEKETASAKMAELDARLKRLDSEVAEIKAQAQREAAAERERLQAEAVRDAEKIRATAQREIEAAKQIAMSELREFAATKSVDLAEQIIRRELKPEDDAQLLKRMGEEMSKVG